MSGVPADRIGVSLLVLDGDRCPARPGEHNEAPGGRPALFVTAEPMDSDSAGAGYSVTIRTNPRGGSRLECRVPRSAEGRARAGCATVEVL